MEFRWINGAYHYRYRNQLMLERPFKITKFKLNPYGAAEAFWDQRYKDWNIFKFTGAFRSRSSGGPRSTYITSASTVPPALIPTRTFLV